MNDNTRRLVLYGAGGAVFAALSWAGFIYRADPDYMTLVSGAQMRAQAAAFIPRDVADANLQTLREDGLRGAERQLAIAERNEPGTSAVRQLRAWIAVQRGQHDRAVELYAEARSCDDVTAEVRRQLGEMLAGALSNAGRFDEALSVLEEDQAERVAGERVRADLLRSRILERSGRHDDALRTAVEASAAAQPQSTEAAGAATVLEALGAWSEASEAWGRATEPGEIREYHLARLKLRSGATDNAVRLLESVITRGGDQVRNLLRQDRAIWSQAVGESAVEQLLEPTVESQGSQTTRSRGEEEKV